ncbi:MAG: peptidoglycan synthetase, partial [Flavobacteriaceae bacterium]|nr:peptidoglycan synthetase [Flavobacteriaceae bacterium]
MKRYHFIAIGGSAMNSLAIALKEHGNQISGSDDAIFDPSRTKLIKAGIYPEKMGWYPEKISTDLDAVILGMHAKADNLELLAAQRLELKIYSYPEFIAHFANQKTRVVIAGSHGKTTISAMVLHVLNYHGRSVDFMFGGQLSGYNNSVSLTKNNDFILLEGDEYLSSPIDSRPKFHHYKPQIALISGISWDHVNVFKTLADYNKQFEIFMDSITPGGVLVY